MASAGGRLWGGRMPFVGLCLLLAVLVTGLLAGCAAGAPQTYTPVAPTPVPGPTAPGHAGGQQPDSSDLPGDGPGSAETRQGRGDKEPVSYAELVDLGEQMTAALDSGDVEAWMALTALRGEAAQQQRDWFAGVQAVPMDLREMLPTSLRERDVAGDIEGPLVEFTFRHQVSGVDVLPSVELYDLTLERVGTDGPYRVVGVSGSDSFDAAYPQLWDLRPVEVVETEHTVLIAEDGSDVEALAGALDEAAAAVFDAFPVEGVDRMSVTVVDEALVATVLGESEEGAYAGFAVPVPTSSAVEESGTLPEVVIDDRYGARLVIDQPYVEEEWFGYGEPDGGSPLMRHEGLHLAMMLRHPDEVAPRWTVEGFAGWFELTGDPALRESHELWYPTVVDDDGLPTALPPEDSWGFFADDPDVIEQHYLESANVFLFVEDTYGADVAASLGDALHQHDVWLDSEEDLDVILVDQLGVDLAAFEVGYVNWVRDTYST